MIDFFSSWGQGIIVAVIIGTIIEMILPEGSSKKYIKVVIGIYILFTIISPFIQKFSGSKLSAENILNTEKYEKMMAKGSNTISQKLEDNNSRTIKDIYTENLKTDIKAKLKEKGYEAESIYLRVSDDGNYTIEKLQIKLLATENKNNGNTETKKVEINSVNVEKIEIAGDGKTKSVKEKNQNTGVEKTNSVEENESKENEIIDSKEEKNESLENGKGYTSSKKEELQEYLSNTYNIQKEKIEIY
jgi:stage III sporulation protein AF